MYKVRFTNNWHDAVYNYESWREFDTSGMTEYSGAMVCVTGDILNNDPTAPKIVAMEGKQFQSQRGYILAEHPYRLGEYVAKGITYSAKTLASFARQRKMFDVE